MKYKLVCCEVFTREACIAIAESPHIVDPDFTPKGAHETPSSLRELLQDRIDSVDANRGYDAVLLGFGVCGNSTISLKAGPIPVIIPRAHDCCTIFLGSRDKFQEYFKDRLSAEWTSTGYMERGTGNTRETDTTRMLGLDLPYDKLVELYGEDNAKYLWETLHPPKVNDELLFIDVPETSHLGYLNDLRMMAQKQQKVLQVLPGDMGIIRNLINGHWPESDFLYVPPGGVIKGVYDQELVITVDQS